MARFADFFKLVQPQLTDSDAKADSPGRATPIQKPTPPSPARVEITDPLPQLSPKQRKLDKHIRQFSSFLSTRIIDLDRIREIAWMGIPQQFRPRIWRLFLDYEPINSAQSESTLDNKRKDYRDCLDRLFSPSQRQLWTSVQKQTLHQIIIDLPRTPIPLLRNPRVNILFQHVLFIWAVRHPASGYVQGMNDILLPFFCAFLSEHLPPAESFEAMANRADVDCVPDEKLMEVETDCFWCFGKLLDGIQDVYTRGQPGLYRMIDHLDALIQKVEPRLAEWMVVQDVKYSSFAFRWMNCLLVREFTLPLMFRVWDLFLSDHARITATHVYVCGAMLGILAPELLKLEGPEFIMKVQNLPVEFWTLEKLETVLAQAFVYEKAVCFGPNRMS
jgi:hypothetical protein